MKIIAGVFVFPLALGLLFTIVASFQPKRIVCGVDSLTWGQVSPGFSDGGYPARLSKLVAGNVLNAGRCGWTTAMYATEGLPDGDSYVLLAGTNDLANHCSPWETSRWIEVLIRQAKGKPVYLVTIPPSRLIQPKDRDALNGFMVKFDYPNVHTVQVDWKQSDLGSDGIHLTPAGYDKVAMAVASAINPR